MCVWGWGGFGVSGVRESAYVSPGTSMIFLEVETKSLRRSSTGHSSERSSLCLPPPAHESKI